MNNVYDVWFSLIDISNKDKLKILNTYKVEEVWKFKLQDFTKLKIDIDKKSISKIIDINYRKILNKYYEFLNKNNIYLISFKDKEYPVNLKFIYNKPAFIYVRGNLNNLNKYNIAIVGSRNASNYGESMARKIAKEISDKNINVVSGLAIGIDKYAHLGSLDSNLGKTIAVLGTGITDEEIYPFQNKKIFERILEKDGTIVSEFKVGTKPEKFNFPLRNRIISGLSKKVIIVEAEENSGSLITADLALEQGKDVFAVPGNITSKKSIGTNKLISEGAYVYLNINDVL